MAQCTFCGQSVICFIQEHLQHCAEKHQGIPLEAVRVREQRRPKKPSPLPGMEPVKAKPPKRPSPLPGTESLRPIAKARPRAVLTIEFFGESS